MCTQIYSFCFALAELGKLRKVGAVTLFSRPDRLCQQAFLRAERSERIVLVHAVRDEGLGGAQPDSSLVLKVLTPAVGSV